MPPAERDVLRLLGTGQFNTEVADQLYPRVSTVKAHISGILPRTGCANRVQAAVLVHDAGLLTDRWARTSTAHTGRAKQAGL
ncbi:response regulator transcription factor [Streptomyces sp. NPDC087844]|uniref:response regulator transcription factor n=1 Tax=Streptomyces sp. NPDC087844 TaxID=3365805 RepID=UPI0037FAA683